MDPDLLGRYITALTNLYGVVPEKKVVDIYNLYNIPRANLGDLEMSVSRIKLQNQLVTRKAGYFIKDYLMFEDKYLGILEQQNGREYYIPEQEELLNYEDEFYFHATKEFQEFKVCLGDCFYLDPKVEDELIDLLMMDCQMGFDIKKAMSELSKRKLEFESIDDMNNFMKAFQGLCTNARKWQYCGHTYKELNSKKRFNQAKNHLSRLLQLRKG